MTTAQLTMEEFMTAAPLAMPLNLTCGILWTIAYILIIKRGFQDKSYGMPLWPLAINITWEFIYAFIFPVTFPRVAHVHIVWFLFDCIIVYQYFRYWQNHKDAISPSRDISPRLFYAWSILAFITSAFAVIFLQYDAITVRGPIEGFPEGFGIHYSAFGSNAIMSIIFIYMIWTRNSVAGQSIYIALAKGIGTGMASIRNSLYPELATTPGSDELLFPLFYAACFIFDMIYVVLVYQKCKEEGINPWKRF